MLLWCALVKVTMQCVCASAKYHTVPVLQAEGSSRHDPTKQDLEQQIAELQAALADLDRPKASHNAHISSTS